MIPFSCSCLLQHQTFTFDSRPCTELGPGTRIQLRSPSPPGSKGLVMGGDISFSIQDAEYGPLSNDKFICIFHNPRMGIGLMTCSQIRVSISRPKMGLWWRLNVPVSRQQHLDQFSGSVFLVNLGVIMVLGVEPTRQGAWKHSLSPLHAS